MKTKNRWKNSIIFKLVVMVLCAFVAMILLYNIITNFYLKCSMEEVCRQLQGVEMDSVQEVICFINNIQIKSTFEFRVFSTFTILGILLTGGVIFYFVITHLMRPLKKLSADVLNIDYNNIPNFEKNQILTGSSDEIEELAQAFNKSLHKLYEDHERQKAFNANVAHELRTPLAVLRSKIALFQAKNPVGIEETCELVYSMDADVSRLTQLVDKLLLLMSEKPLDYKEVDLKALVEEIFLDLEDAAAEKNICLHLEGERLQIETDDGLIERVLFNLIENAVKYNLPGGRVDVILTDKGSNIEIKVADTGIGIPEEERKHIFDIYYRIDNSRSRSTGGYGIGLSLVYEIVRKLQASVTIESNSPQGTIFVLNFQKCL